MNRFLRGFSLVELLVVVGIMAVIAAIAVPAYQQYVIASQFHSLRTLIDPLVAKSITYAQTHKKFGDPYEVGVIAAPMPAYGIGAADKLNLLPGFVTSWYYGLTFNDYDGSSGCGGHGRVQMRFDTTNVTTMKLPANSVLDIFVEYWYDSATKVIKKQYIYGVTSPTGVRQYAMSVPGWTNMHSSGAWGGNYPPINPTCPP